MTSSPETSTPQIRWAQGKAQRTTTPRLALGDLHDRPAGYDAVGRLIEQGGDRVAQLLPLRYQRMLKSPLAFLRGASILMADDLARGPSTSLDVQICGDAHIANFGIFESPERDMVFDVNDFDETAVGPFEWDVKRLAASLVVAARELGMSAHDQESIALNAGREYRRSLARFAMMSRLDVWYSRVDLDETIRDLKGFFSDAASEKIDDVIRHFSSLGDEQAQAKVVLYRADGPVMVDNPPHFSHEFEGGANSMSAKNVLDVLVGYAHTLSSDRQALLRQFSVRDVARHVVGVGSVGTECFAVLLTGRDEYDPFLLQIKEAEPSVVVSSRSASTLVEDGERVVQGQRLMQATPDVFLGWHTIPVGERDRTFYVRQLYLKKATITLEGLEGPHLLAYARLCAWTLARAHARFGTSCEIAGYLGKANRFDESMAAFALAYGDRNQKDFEELTDAAASGRITVAT
jgi:uncharacterized protein (DUF2252 family)